MRRRNTRMIAGPVVLGLALLGTGCGPDDTGTAAEEGQAEETGCGGAISTGAGDPTGAVEIDVQWEGAWDDVAAPALLERWDDGREDVEVTVEAPLPHAASVQALLGEHPPVVARVPADAVAGLAKAGAIQPLGPCLDPGTATSSIEPAQPIGVVDGSQWGVPTNLFSRALLIDRAAFVAAGLDPDDPPQTLDELQETARAIRAATGMERPVAGLVPEDAMFGAATTADASASASAFDELALEGLLISAPEIANARLHPLGDGTSAIEAVNPSQLWGYGSALSQGQAPDADLAVVPLPGPDGPVVPVTGEVWVASSAATPEQVAAAADLVDWLAADEQQAALHALTDQLPLTEAAAGHPTVQARWQEIPLLADLWQLVSTDGQAIPGWMHTPGAPETVNQAVGKAAFEGVDLAQTWPEVASSIDHAATIVGPNGNPDHAAYLSNCLFPPLPERLHTLVECS